MKKTLLLACFATLFYSTLCSADNHKDELAEGLAVIVTSDNHQTQMMAMILSLQSIKAHQKDVHITLCGPAGDLALKGTETPKIKPVNASPSMMLQKLLKMGATIEVCPLYLPNKNKTEKDLIEGLTVAEPVKIAERLLNKSYKNLTY